MSVSSLLRHVRSCPPCRWWTILLALLALLPLATVAHGQSTPPLRRIAADSFWQARWMVGGDSTSDTFVEPRHIVVSTSLVVVLDDGTREIRGFDAVSGAVRFVLRPTGEGPGEFRRPAVVISTRDGFAILDHATARLTAYNRRAQRLWDTVLPDVFGIAGLCMANDSVLVASYRRRDQSLLILDRRGRRIATANIPWRMLVARAPSFAYAHDLASSGRAPCAVAPVFGAEWAVVDSRLTPRVYPLWEPGPQPTVDVKERVLSRTLSTVTVQSQESSDTPAATRGVAVHGDTVIVYAAHSRESPLRLLDYYLASSGRYLYSRRLPFPVNGFAVGDDGTVYVTRITTTASSIMALMPVRARPGEMPARPAPPGRAPRRGIP